MATLTTPIFGLPYPNGAERVMDGDNAIGALALAVESAIELRDGKANVAVGGPVFTQTAANQKLPLATLIQGSAALFDDPNDRLIIPPGSAGHWMVTAFGSTFDYLANAYLRLTMRLNGSNVAGASPSVSTAASTFWNMAAALRLADNDYLELFIESAAGDMGTIQVVRFGMVRVGRSI